MFRFLGILILMAVAVQSQLQDDSAPANNSTTSKLRIVLRKLFNRSVRNKHADKNRIILEDLQYRQINPEFTNSSAIAFHDEETVAIVSYINKTVENCKLMEVNLASQAIGVLRNLSVHMPIYPVGTKTMVKLIKLCQNAGGPVGSRRRGSARALRLDKKDNSTSPSWTNFLTTIVPGTKWCGPGDIAESYEDLGPLADADKCCRAHDHCPIKVKGLSTAHGLVNFSFYTKSHCACDDDFYSCLKSVPSAATRMIGNMYFNVIHMDCVDEELTFADEPSTLPKLDFLPPDCVLSSGGDCERPSAQPFVSKPYKFVNVNREF